MRQINNTEQFIKAKQAIAQQERGKGTRNVKKNLNMTEIQAIANSTNSSFMQTQYNKGMIDQGLIL
jgi:cell division protein FtsI/penicillin-binding protein 2